MKTTNMQGWGIALLRVMVGIVFLMHGGQKLFVFGINGTAGFFAQAGFPMPMVSAVLASLTEFLGGTALIAGLFTRLAAIPLAFTMLVAVLGVHLRNGFFLPTGFEYAFAMLVVVIALALTGPGELAVDNRRR